MNKEGKTVLVTAINSYAASTRLSKPDTFTGAAKERIESYIRVA